MKPCGHESGSVDGCTRCQRWNTSAEYREYWSKQRRTRTEGETAAVASAAVQAPTPLSPTPQTQPPQPPACTLFESAPRVRVPGSMRDWRQCPAGHGVVCRCDGTKCGPQCKDYQRPLTEPSEVTDEVTDEASN